MPVELGDDVVDGHCGCRSNRADTGADVLFRPSPHFDRAWLDLQARERTKGKNALLCSL